MIKWMMRLMLVLVQLNIGKYFPWKISDFHSILNKHAGKYNGIQIHRIHISCFTISLKTNKQLVNRLYREDILTHCNNHRKKSKLKVVSCLSEIIVSDAMNKAASLSNGVEMSSSGPSISPHCQKEVKFQLLQKHSSIKLNPLVVSILKNIRHRDNNGWYH